MRSPKVLEVMFVIVVITCELLFVGARVVNEPIELSNLSEVHAQ